MKLQVPFVQLPLLFDADALAAEVDALSEASWLPHPQRFAGNSMLPLVAVHGDPENELFSGPMRPTAHLEACPYLAGVIASLGATVGRTRLMRLAGHAEVTRHVDQGYYWAERVRVHVPVVTQPTVRFECGGVEVNMKPGECWIFDTWRQHRVLNDAVHSRIHLVVDTVGGIDFWDLVARGRTVPDGGGSQPWRPETIAPTAGLRTDLRLEVENVPSVMTPWELQVQLDMLFSDVVPHPQVAPLQQRARVLVRSWKCVWAQYGDSEQGRPHFRALLGRFRQEAERPGQAIGLQNGVAWYSAFMARIAKVAIGREATQHPMATESSPLVEPARQRP